jgi:acyl-homoserine lactone synthase
MIKVLTGKQRGENAALFEQLFRLRHDVFIKRRNWSLGSRLGQLEIDEYDVDEAIYVFDFDNLGGILASVRLTPSDRYSLIADYFPHLVEDDFFKVRSPDVYEGMRFMTAPVLSSKEAARARLRVLYAMVEWCLEHRIRWIQGATDVEFFPTFVQMTIQTTPMGLAQEYAGGRKAPGGGECIAFRWPVTRGILEALRCYGEQEALWTPTYVH